MKYQHTFKKINLMILALIAFAAFSIEAKANTNSNAGLKIDRYKNAIIQKLTEKLRVDLADNNVEVRMSDVRNNEISNSRINFDGEALAVIKDDKTELPLQFTAKVNLNKQSVEDVDYKFVEASPEFAPSEIQGNLMTTLMEQISKDYKTTNIVIAIDNFDTSKITSDQTKYEGTGEVRIGDFEWRRINFDVVLDSQNQTATKILYDVQK